MRNRNWMIYLASAGLSLLMLSGLALASTPQQKDSDDKCERDEKTSAAKSKHQSPFACDRLALDPVTRKRHFDELGPALRDMRKAVRELPDGYEFQFSPDEKTVGMVAEWAAQERLCCPFFN